jgi:hypothetical protein
VDPDLGGKVTPDPHSEHGLDSGTIRIQAKSLYTYILDPTFPRRIHQLISYGKKNFKKGTIGSKKKEREKIKKKLESGKDNRNASCGKNRDKNGRMRNKYGINECNSVVCSTDVRYSSILLQRV